MSFKLWAPLWKETFWSILKTSCFSICTHSFIGLGLYMCAYQINYKIHWRDTSFHAGWTSAIILRSRSLRDNRSHHFEYASLQKQSSTHASPGATFRHVVEVQDRRVEVRSFHWLIVRWLGTMCFLLFHNGLWLFTFWEQSSWVAKRAQTDDLRRESRRCQEKAADVVLHT